ncbi:hypothetical protein [Levilactobacillus brevis]|uniref:hypothetical protein n=1 Tax=Levilactobacillus brevis TaxID=1580 RepID=UPI001D03216C|nr:hypothetical protein [Levilactobacillus brevis]
MPISKRKMWIELIINGLLLTTPLLLIINGIAGLAENDPNHPDALILMGVLILGILGLVMTGLTVFRLFNRGWHGIALYQKLLAILYFVCLIIGGFEWLLFTETIPPNWYLH